MTGVMAPIYIGIAQSLGFDVARFCVPLAFMMAYAFFLPFNTTGNLIFMETGHFKPNDLLKSSVPFGFCLVRRVHYRPHLVAGDWADVVSQGFRIRVQEFRSETPAGVEHTVQEFRSALSSVTSLLSFSTRCSRSFI